MGTSNYRNAVRISNRFDYVVHNVLSRIADGEGLFSSAYTRGLIRKLNSYKPDVIHIHNLHGHYLNYRLLFKYIAESVNCRIVMTLHDCWSFTGHCAHFDIMNCEEWKTGCPHCSFKNSYPKTFLSRSRRNFKLKKELIAALGSRLHLVPVSKWMDSFLQESMYKDIAHTVIHNGINLAIFKYCENKRVLARYGIKGEYVLGVAHPWSSYKGLGDMIKLRMSLDQSISIVLVGLSKEQRSSMPGGIIGIAPTSDVNELVALYSSAIALVNTTYCDNYPTVNLESIACGTPVITYRTGGSPESLTYQTGDVVARGDVDGLVKAIYKYWNLDRFEVRRNCTAQAKLLFNQDNCFSDYIDLYSIL